jgi:hypothetical protein
MPLLVISLLTILTGTLLLAKFKKEQAGRFFNWISWFFIVVGGLLFLGSMGHGINKMRHRHFMGERFERPEMGMMMRHCPPSMMGGVPCCCCPKPMEGPGGECCSPKEMEGKCGSMEEAPAPVKEAFTKMFPAATDVKYEMERENFEVNFKDKGVEMSANFDKGGKWLETETGIKESELPKEVSASIAKNFSGYMVSEVAKVEMPDKGVCYEMDLMKDKEGFEVQFSPKGDVIMKHELKVEKDNK